MTAEDIWTLKLTGADTEENRKSYMKTEKGRCQNRRELTFELHETLKQRQDNPMENQSSIT